jgi:hypothetical protein
MRALVTLLLCLLTLGCSPGPRGGASDMVAHVILFMGQSLCTGQGEDAPVGVPLAAVRYWRRVLNGSGNDSAFHDLEPFTNGTHALELQAGLDLTDSFPLLAFVKISLNGGHVIQFLDGHASGNWDLIEAELTDQVIPALATEFPGEPLVWHFLWEQGQAESREETETEANNWAANMATLQGDLETVIGDTFAATYWVRTDSALADAPWLATVRAQGESWADHVIDADNSETLDGTHRTGAADNIIGGRFATAFLNAQEPSSMGTLSAYARNGLMDHLLGVSTFSPPATIYAAAFVAGVEVTGNGYSRAAITNNTTNFPNASSRAKTNGEDIVFDTATGGNWGAIDEIRFFDASTDGNELARDTLTGTQQVDDGDTLQIVAGALDITAAAGSLSDDAAEALLDHLFGSVDITPEATVQFAYFDGDPQAAGVEITGTDYARVVVDTDNVTWNAASSGVGRNLIAFTFPTAGAADWDTADYWALFDAAGTGLIMSAALPAARAIGNGETETIAAGRIRPTWT